MKRILIGNIISTIAVFFFAYSSITKEPKRVAITQILENTILATSSIVLGSWSGAVSCLLSDIRWMLVLKKKFDTKAMWILLILLTSLGLLTNSRGPIGLLPVLATMEITYFSRTCKDILQIKMMLLVNTILWDIYAFYIMDFASGIAWFVIICMNIYTSLKILRERKAAKEEVKTE